MLVGVSASLALIRGEWGRHLVIDPVADGVHPDSDLPRERLKDDPIDSAARFVRMFLAAEIQEDSSSVTSRPDQVSFS